MGRNDKDEPLLQALVVNMRQYEKGRKIGGWVSFPVTEKRIRDLCANAALSAKDISSPGSLTAIRFQSGIPGLTNHLKAPEEPEKLGFLTGILKGLPPDDLKRYQAVLEAGLPLPEEGSAGLINLSYNLRRYDLEDRIKNDRELGEYCVKESGIYDLSAIGGLAKYIDYEAIGRDNREYNGGVYTAFGYVFDTKIPWLHIFKGTIDEVPDVYHFSEIMGLNQQEKKSYLPRFISHHR